MHEFLSKHPNSILFAPTQRKERLVGYDAKLVSNKGVPIFYQFKVSECLNSKGKEYPYLAERYYRFYTYYGKPNNNQHNVLKRLSSICCFSKVFYVAPCFYKNDVFYNYLKASSISNHSRFIRLKKLPLITNNNRHAICYTASGKLRMFSEPVVDDGGALTSGSIVIEQDRESVIDVKEFIKSISIFHDMGLITTKHTINPYEELSKFGSWLMQFGIFFIWASVSN